MFPSSLYTTLDNTTLIDVLHQSNSPPRPPNDIPLPKDNDVAADRRPLSPPTLPPPSPPVNEATSPSTSPQSSSLLSPPSTIPEIEGNIVFWTACFYLSFSLSLPLLPPSPLSLCAVYDKEGDIPGNMYENVSDSLLSPPPTREGQ